MLELTLFTYQFIHLREIVAPGDIISSRRDTKIFHQSMKQSEKDITHSFSTSKLLQRVLLAGHVLDVYGRLWHFKAASNS